MTSTTCQSCGAELKDEGVGGICPKCLLSAERSREGAPLEPLPVELVAELLPNYEILELIGLGGMGFVYKARQPKLERLVAIKVLPLEQVEDPEARARFLREARALAKLNHPNIVTIHDVGESEEFLYFVMEFVEGANLAELIRSGEMTSGRGLKLVSQMCDALEFAHQHDVVHRDIKPSNILIDRNDRVKIADFGISKLLRPDGTAGQLTRPDQNMGTEDYLAPELKYHPAAVDQRADIYSLGVVIYEMLTGELPAGHFELPSEKVHVDVRLDQVVLRALAAKPERRYQHASEVKHDVEQISASEVERGVEEISVRQPASRWRHLTAWIVVVLILLGALAAFFFWNPNEETGLPPVSGSILIIGSEKSFDSIAEALAEVQPGETIRIMGPQTLSGPIQFAHENHGGVTLESTNEVTLECTTETTHLIRIYNVPDVTIRGFTITNEGSDPTGLQSLILAIGKNPGLKLEELTLRSSVPETGVGVSFESIQIGPTDPPAVIRDCRIERFSRGIRLSGYRGDEPDPGRAVMVVNNHFASNQNALTIHGEISDSVVAGNTFHRSSEVAVRVVYPFPQTKNLLIANNTMLECTQAFRLWDHGNIDGTNIRIVNNLCLDSTDPLGLDWAYFDCPDPRGKGVKAGDGSALHDHWTIEHNYRESSGKPTDPKWKMAWIPPGQRNVLLQQIEGIERNSENPHFLRLDNLSPLNRKGAAKGLPDYVGAHPADRSKRFMNWQIPAERKERE